MTEQLADFLKDKIDDASLTWTEVIGGLAFPIEKQGKSDKGDLKTNIFPAGTEVIGGETVGNWEYQPLNPNQNYKSVIFFEEGGTEIVSDRRDNHISKLRLICWLNLKKIGETSNVNMKTDEYAVELLEAIQGSQGNSNEFLGIYVELNAIAKRDKDIWNKYSFNQAVAQYLTFPYSYFAIDLTLRYRYNYACLS